MTHEEMATWLETWGEAALNISEGERLREIAAEFRRMIDDSARASRAQGDRRMTAPDDLGVDPFDIGEGDVLVHHPTGERREILCAAWLMGLVHQGDTSVDRVLIVTYRTALEGGGTVNLSEVARSDQWLDWCNEAYLEGGL